MFERLGLVRRLYGLLGCAVACSFAHGSIVAAFFGIIAGQSFGLFIENQQREQRRRFALRLFCRACGALPPSPANRRWGGLLPLELITGAHSFVGESDVFLCPACSWSIWLEVVDLPSWSREARRACDCDGCSVARAPDAA